MWNLVSPGVNPRPSLNGCAQRISVDPFVRVSPGVNPRPSLNGLDVSTTAQGVARCRRG